MGSNQPINVGLDAFAAQFQAQVDNAGPRDPNTPSTSVWRWGFSQPSNSLLDQWYLRDQCQEDESISGSSPTTC